MRSPLTHAVVNKKIVNPIWLGMPPHSPLHLNNLSTVISSEEEIALRDEFDSIDMTGITAMTRWENS